MAETAALPLPSPPLKGGGVKATAIARSPKFQMRSSCRFAQGNGADPEGCAASRPNGEGPVAEHGPEEGRVSSGSSS